MESYKIVDYLSKMLIQLELFTWDEINGAMNEWMETKDDEKLESFFENKLLDATLIRLKKGKVQNET